MATLEKDFTATGVGTGLSVRSDDKATYAVAGTFVGTVVLEKSLDGGTTWTTVTSATGSASGTVHNQEPKSAIYRWRCSAFTSGTIETEVADVAIPTGEFGGGVIGTTESGATVTGTLAVSGAVTSGGVAVPTISSTSTLTNKTLTAPVLGGTITGTYTLGGTPTITSPTLTTPNLGVATATSLKNTAGVGTANTGTTAVEYGDGRTHQTVLTVSTTLPAIAGGADLAVGKLLYTLPAGAHVIESAYMSIGITQSQGNINADTPDVGLGTVIGSGVVAVLGGTATFEDIITGQTAANCTGTATVKTAIPTAAVPLVIEAGGAKTIYLNVADGWAASGDAAAVLAGTVVINWRTMA